MIISPSHDWRYVKANAHKDTLETLGASLAWLGVDGHCHQVPINLDKIYFCLELHQPTFPYDRQENRFALSQNLAQIIIGENKTFINKLAVHILIPPAWIEVAMFEKSFKKDTSVKHFAEVFDVPFNIANAALSHFLGHKVWWYNGS